MATCVAQRTSIQLPPITQHQTFLHKTTYDCEMSKVSCRKRLFSDQNDRYSSDMKYFENEDEITKRRKTGIINHESKDEYHHGIHCSAPSFFESTRISRSAPAYLRRQSLTHAPFTYIKHISSQQTADTFLPTLLTTTTLENKMLVCQQKSVDINDNQIDRNNNSIFLTCSQLAAYITTSSNNINGTILIVDCGSPLRHTERRIENSLLINVNDKISRKRLTTRGLKNFLDSNQLNRVDKNDIIVLYDDSIRPPICSTSTNQCQLAPPTKCVYDEIKRYSTNKMIYVLQSPFNEFYQHHPSFCYISTSTDEDLALPSPLTIKQIDIDTCSMSEIMPGLYLGNSNDAENLNLLKENNINVIINISTSIPCYFESESSLKYHRLPCHDSPNQNILQYFETTFEYINNQLLDNKNIFVHCQGGVSRSPSFIIGYLMKYHNKTFDDAYNLTRSKRNIINPNLNFLGQLTQYQQMLTSA